MGSRERREREKTELREKILDAARTLFATEGIEATTMRRIATAIEYSPTAIYLYFPDKDALLRELCAVDFAQLSSKFFALLEEEDPLERLKKAGRAYARFAEEHPHAFRLMFMQSSKVRDDLEHSGEPATDAYAFLLATVQACIEAKKLKPELKDAELVAQTVWSGIHGVVALHVTMADCGGHKWRPISKRIGMMLDLMVQGIAR
jgi:AcrR family transcriptional regulator